MKRIFGLGLLVVALFAAAAFGAQFAAGRIVVNVADGWSAGQDDSTVVIVKDDNTAAMTITLESQGGADLGALAAEWSKQLGGTAPRQMTEGDFAGDYTFDFTNAQGVKSEALISGDGTDYIVVVVTGVENNPEAEAAAMAMVGSIAIR